MIKVVRRYDYEPGSTRVERTPEGFLRVDARASRVGVFRYRTPEGGVVRELRSPEEVFHPDSMATLSMKPITNDHPSGLVDSKSAALHTVGFTGELVRKVDGKFLEISTVITDADTIRDAESGKVEVSPGYLCELDFTPGVFDGEEYDAVQRKIRYNHLALVGKGRQGPEVRLKLDADDAVQVGLNQKENRTVKKIKLDGKEFEVADDVASAVECAMKKAGDEKAAAEQATQDAKAALSAATGENDKLAAKCDSVENELKKAKAEKPATVKTDSDEFTKAVQARVKLEAVAKVAGVEKIDGVADLELKKAVIKADAADVNLDGKTEAYIEARFDMAVESIEKADAAAKKIGEGLNGRKPAEKLDSADARQRMIDRQRNAWKQEEQKKENK